MRERRAKNGFTNPEIAQAVERVRWRTGRNRHFLNLATHKAFEAVNLIRRRCANFHLGLGHKR